MHRPDLCSVLVGNRFTIKRRRPRIARDLVQRSIEHRVSTDPLPSHQLVVDPLDHVVEQFPDLGTAREWPQIARLVSLLPEMVRNRLDVWHDQGRNVQLSIAKDDGLIDKWAGSQRTLDGGRHYLAPRGQHDKGLLAPRQMQITVRIKTAQIARV